MDAEIKALMEALGNSINEALAESERIGKAIADIRLAGYDTLLLLEATIQLAPVTTLEEVAEGQAALVQ